MKSNNDANRAARYEQFMNNSIDFGSSQTYFITERRRTTSKNHMPRFQTQMNYHAEINRTQNDSVGKENYREKYFSERIKVE